MYITEEEFRQERKRAIEVLEEFKKLEEKLELRMVRIDEKTVKYVRKSSGVHKKKRRSRSDQAAAGWPDISLLEYFGEADCGEPVIF